MPLVLAKCTNCGATLSVDNTKDAAVCKFCDSAFIVEKAVNNYNISNNNNNITNSVVNIYGGNSADFIIRAGTLEKYTGASTEVVIPNTVTIIGANAFRCCSGLTSVKIPDTVTIIESNAFSGCSGLTSVKIPDSVTEIHYQAFARCSRLKYVNIPKKMTIIQEGTFEGCKSLEKIEIPDNIIYICEKAFRYCTLLNNIYIPDSVKDIYYNADSESYENGTFHGCTSLKNIRLPENLKGSWNIVFMNSPAYNILMRKVEENQKGCYIATCVYKSYDCPEVWTLRRFRDNTLLKSWYGKLFVKVYYAVSPYLVQWFGKTKWFNKLCKPMLYKLTCYLKNKGVSDCSYKDM